MTSLPDDFDHQLQGIGYRFNGQVQESPYSDLDPDQPSTPDSYLSYSGDGFEVVLPHPIQVYPVEKSTRNWHVNGKSIFWGPAAAMPVCPRCDETELSLIDRLYVFCNRCYLSLWAHDANDLLASEE